MLGLRSPCPKGRWLSDLNKSEASEVLLLDQLNKLISHEYSCPQLRNHEQLRCTNSVREEDEFCELHDPATWKPFNLGSLKIDRISNRQLVVDKEITFVTGQGKYFTVGLQHRSQLVNGKLTENGTTGHRRSKVTYSAKVVGSVPLSIKRHSDWLPLRSERFASSYLNKQTVVLSALRYEAKVPPRVHPQLIDAHIDPSSSRTS